MKTTTNIIAMLVITFSAVAIAVAGNDSNDGLVSVLATKAVIQDAAEPPTPVAVPESAAEEVAPVQPVAQDPVAPVAVEAAAPSVVVDSVVIGQPVAGFGCCQSCCATPCCCCPPAPIKTSFCLVDPCGCSHQACVCVPACCAGEQPCITWRNGLFGRQIATMCWTCCGHKVRVIICRSGKVKVRG